ncbi:MAG: hypothetical protein AAF806_02195 [Bacteroidota bacterium]
MSEWLVAILEIIKISVPAIVVFLTVQTLLKQYLNKQYQLRQLEYSQSKKDGSLNIRLQAYERLALLCERISIPNLILRLRTSEMTNADLKAAMLIAIQQEFEHNTSQQIYVSEQLWKILQFARVETMNTISGVAETVDSNGNAQEFADTLFKYIDDKEINVNLKVQTAIRKETQLLF